MLNQVFISYRHESPEHARAVRRLGELLREAEIPVLLDQFYLDEHPGGPDEGGWPKWCEDAANRSDCVLIVASEGWFAAYDKSAPPGTGLGAASEADLFRQALYDDAGNNAHIRLVFLHAVAQESPPARLRAWHHFRPFDSDAELDGLVRWIAQRLNLGDIHSPTVRWPAPIPFEPDLADRSEHEWPAVRELLAGRSRERILLYEGGSGLGKSLLLRQAGQYARQLGVPVVHVDFKESGLDVAAILGHFDLELGDRLPNFTCDNKAHLLRKDLRALRQPVLVLFDTYEAIAGNPPLEDWLNLQFLPEVETALGLAVIVAGQKVPDPRKAVWRERARHLPLRPITELDHWQPWVARRYPAIHEQRADLRTLLLAASGNPAVVSGLCEVISKGRGAP